MDWTEIAPKYHQTEIPIEVVKLLAEKEVKAGGPYYEISSSRISLESNLSICIMLLKHNIFLDELVNYLDGEIESSQKKCKLVEEYFHERKKVKGEFKYKYILEKLTLPTSLFLDRILKNSFTLEIVAQPYQLNGAFELGLSTVELDRIALVNLYGWIYFAILDVELDKHSAVSEDMREVMMRSLREAKRLLGKNKKLKWIAEARKIMQNEGNSYSEEDSIRKSRPLYLSILKYLSRDQVAALDLYYLAKQYNDDLHDFVDDYKANRNSLVMSMFRGGDQANEYINRIIPLAYNRIKELLSDSAKVLHEFQPYQKLSYGMAELDESLELAKALLA